MRLIGGQDTLGAMAEAAQYTLADVAWTRRLTGFAGTPYAAWTRYVAQEVSGITWPEFRDLVGIYNPALAQTDDRFVAGSVYVLPENPPDRRAQEIVWDRPLRGFSGSLYDAWRRYVENKVTGLTYDQFKATAAEHNPALAGEGNFRATSATCSRAMPTPASMPSAVSPDRGARSPSRRCRPGCTVSR